MATERPGLWERFWVRLLGALDARSGRWFACGASEIMAARPDELRRLSRIPKSYSVRAAQGDDEPQVARLMGGKATTAPLGASGDIGLLAVADGEVQAMEWIRPGPAEYDRDAKRLGLVFRVPRGSCWLHNGSGGESGARGPWAMILGRLPGFLEEQGIERAYLQVACGNEYSRRCHEALGFRKIGRVVNVRLGRLRFVRWRGEGETWLRWRESRLDLERHPI